jgi:MFS family permease
VGLANLIFTIAALALIDKIGRKPLLLIGITGIVLSMFVLAYGFNAATYQINEESVNSISTIMNDASLNDMMDVVYQNEEDFKIALNNAANQSMTLQQEQEILPKAIQLNSMLILWAILFFVASFAISIGPVMWVLFSELFPNRVRAVAISFVGFINSVVSFTVQLVFPWELENLGTSTTFLIYGIFALIGLLFILLKVPETKGKSLEELQSVFLNNEKSIASN